MKVLKVFAVAVLSLGLAACAANKTHEEEADIPRLPERDPIIQIEAEKNAKLFKQSVDEMAESRQLPDITYEFDSIQPPDYSYEFLDKLAELLLTRRNMKLIIEGNADIVGDKEYNYWLGSSRASAMKAYLVSRGVLADRIRIHSYGADRPLTLDTSKEGRRTNRRVHFVLTTRTWQSVY
ncbi:MAG: OmpA family protein [Elusimicrobiaceae bacterium]|nr:OmpA family protein [Elusimicrobiaceae bacterium]